MLPFLCNVCITARHGERVNVDDPWGYGNSLEWATSCPPPRHNFTAIPRIRSERPAFDLHYPHTDGATRSDGRRRDGGLTMKIEGYLFVFARSSSRRGRRLLAAGRTTRPAPPRWPSRWAWPAWSASTSCSPAAASARGPRTTRKARSPTARASSASSARTAGGRCSPAPAAATVAVGVVIGWWLVDHRHVRGDPDRDRVRLRVLPGSLLALRFPKKRSRRPVSPRGGAGLRAYSPRTHGWGCV